MGLRIITADYVFPVNGEKIKDGYVECLPSGEIVSVGKISDRDFGSETVEHYNGVIVPGFINAHCHIELSHLKGLFRKGTGMDGFIQQINSLRTTVGYDERMGAMMEAFDDLYRQGVSGMGDISNCSESFEMKRYSPMFTRTFLEVFGTEPEDAPKIIEDVLELQKEAEKYGIKAAPTPHSCYTMSPLLNRLAAAEGLKSGYISYHSQESQEEEDMLRYGTGPLADDYKGRGTTQLPVTGEGALKYFIDNLAKEIEMPVKENVILVHNVATDQESIDYAKSHLSNVYWAICPLSNVFIHNALPPLGLMRDNKLDICIGTDSLSSNDLLSMVAEIRCIQENFPEISFDELLSWATVNGARAIGAESLLGTLESGKKPGVVLIENIDLDTFILNENSKSIRLV